MTVRKVKSGSGPSKRRVQFADSSRRSRRDTPLFDKSKRREHQFAFDFFDNMNEEAPFDDDISFIGKD